MKPDIRLFGQPDIRYPAKPLAGYPAKSVYGTTLLKSSVADPDIFELII